MSNHDAVAAVPISGNIDKSLLRNLVTKRVPYVLADADDVTTLTAVDPSTGAAIIDILFLGRVFHYDSTDTTTANDGVSCLVSFDGRRYKLSSSAEVFAFAVIDNTHATPPGSPTIGDSYLIAAAATGAWVGKSNFVTVYTRRGWEFINFGIGRLIYVEAIDTYYHKNAGGAWVTGLGAQTLAAKSVPLSAAINFGARLIVENQTTTAPPGSPTVGTAYVIGPSATGAWAGLDSRVAICEVAGSFVVYTPGNGWSAYDKSKNATFNYNGAAWISSAGAFSNTASSFNNVWSQLTTVIPFDDTIPQLSEGQLISRILYTPKSTTSILRINFRANISGGAIDHAIAALFLNSNAAALKASAVYLAAAGAMTPISLTHEFVPGVTTQITLDIHIGPATGGNSIYVNGLPGGRHLGAVDAAVITVDEITA